MVIARAHTIFCEHNLRISSQFHMQVLSAHVTWFAEGSDDDQHQ
jgi:hypothetical protein